MSTTQEAASACGSIVDRFFCREQKLALKRVNIHHPSIRHLIGRQEKPRNVRLFDSAEEKHSAMNADARSGMSIAEIAEKYGATTRWVASVTKSARGAKGRIVVDWEPRFKILEQYTALVRSGVQSEAAADMVGVPLKSIKSTQVIASRRRRA